MTTKLCPTCRVVRDFLQVLTAADDEPAKIIGAKGKVLGTVVRKVPELLEPVTNGREKAEEAPPIAATLVQKLVQRRRSYEEEPEKSATMEGCKEADRSERTQGIIDGLQIAIDLLACELCVTVDDPAPPKRRVKPASPAEEGSKPITIGPSTYALGLLRALKQLVGIRTEGVASDESIALVAGRSVTSSTFDIAIGELLEDALLDGGPKARFLTAKGSQVAGDVAPIKRGDELLAFWSSKLEPIEAKILAASVKLSRERTGSIAKERIAFESGYSATSSSTDNALSRLRKVGLIQEGSNRCAEELR